MRNDTTRPPPTATHVTEGQHLVNRAATCFTRAAAATSTTASPPITGMPPSPAAAAKRIWSVKARARPLAKFQSWGPAVSTADGFRITVRTLSNSRPAACAYLFGNPPQISRGPRRRLTLTTPKDSSASILLLY